jgi:vacuolar-type H+-ATPase subunit F/Vma7
MAFIAMFLLGFGILTFLFGTEEMNIIKEENKLTNEVKKIIDKENGIILIKGESIYKIKVDKKIHNVYLEDEKTRY